MGDPKTFLIGVLVGFVLLPTEASAEWWKKNLEQYSYNASIYKNSGHVIDARCQLEKGYTHRINFEAGLDSKVIALGYTEKDMQDVAYRVIDFEQRYDDRDYARGICRIEVLFAQSSEEASPSTANSLLSPQNENDALSPQAGNSPSFLQIEKR
ncbi:MAG: hypothetical protein WAK01_06500 [Methylocystis sp.]